MRTATMLGRSLVAAAWMLGACSPVRGSDDVDGPTYSSTFSLAGQSDARIGEITTVQAFEVLRVSEHCTNDAFEGTRCSPGWMRPIPFDVETAACEDGSCRVLSIGEWSERTGRFIEVVPTTTRLKLRVVAVGGSEETIEVLAAP